MNALARNRTRSVSNIAKENRKFTLKFPRNGFKILEGVFITGIIFF